MNTIIYLVATLIEYHDEPPTDCHSLYANYEDAKKAMKAEIEECMENFTAEKGDIVIYLDTVFEWRDEDGNAFTITIEEMNVKQLKY